MMRAIRTVMTLAILVIAAGCGGSAARGDNAPRGNLITFEELEERGTYTNLYDVIEVLRPRWLRTQGPDTFMGQPGEVQVHIDGNWLGSVQTLRSLSPAGVTSIRWLAPIDASARYGLDHSHGAIVISTAPVH
ncbi:MAG TPA: hypothetical protein VFZ18_15210 [Longimicrobiaceae bacterium]